MAVVCRLHPTKKNGLRSSEFLGEFSEFVGSLPINRGQLFSVGDFTIQWDSPSDANTKHLSSIVRSASLIICKKALTELVIFFVRMTLLLKKFQ